MHEAADAFADLHRRERFGWQVERHLPVDGLDPGTDHAHRAIVLERQPRDVAVGAELVGGHVERFHAPAVEHRRIGDPRGQREPQFVEREIGDVHVQLGP